MAEAMTIDQTLKSLFCKHTELYTDTDGYAHIAGVDKFIEEVINAVDHHTRTTSTGGWVKVNPSEIKFRAERLDDKIVVKGVPLLSINGRAYIIHGATEDAINTLNEVDFFYNEVVPESIDQLLPDGGER